jgi:hypothetical protein
MTDLLPFQPSLASATNTRLDTSCRHHQQCRVSTDDMLAYTLPAKNDHEELQRNKYRYCIHKDEFVVGIGRPWVSQVTRKRTNNAYPRVISNLGQLSMKNDGKLALMMIRYMYHYARTIQEKADIIDWFSDKDQHYAGVSDAGVAIPSKDWAFSQEEKKELVTWLPLMADQIPVGYAQTLGWAHPHTGDTMVTVMIGGLRTVMNGDFEVFPGDLVQWYWPFEKDCFRQDGRRKAYVNGWTMAPVGGRNKARPPNVSPELEYAGAGLLEATGLHPERSVLEREAFHSRTFGNESENKTKLVARVKPFFRDDDNPRIYDAYRVFGIAIAAARPHEMLDIKISKQSV